MATMKMLASQYVKIPLNVPRSNESSLITLFSPATSVIFPLISKTLQKNPVSKNLVAIIQLSRKNRRCRVVP